MNKDQNRRGRYRQIWCSTALLLICLAVGCIDLGRRTTKLLISGMDTPTPYITPALQGTPSLKATQFPQGTPVYDQDLCQMDGEGYKYLLDIAVAYYPFNHGMRKEASEADHDELPPLIDKMRAVHTKLRSINPPPECEIMLSLDYAYEAEVDQTIRTFVAFYNAEPEDTWMGFLAEATFYNAQVKTLLDRIYFRD